MQRFQGLAPVMYELPYSRWFMLFYTLSFCGLRYQTKPIWNFEGALNVETSRAYNVCVPGANPGSSQFIRQVAQLAEVGVSPETVE